MAKDPIDAYVGAQVKLRRVTVGMTQTELADRLGITFQQVQKYEKGTNRMGASRLHAVASILDVPLQSFFDGVEAAIEEPMDAHDGAKDEVLARYEEFIRSPTGVDLGKTFLSIDKPITRKRIMVLMKSIVAAQ